VIFQVLIKKEYVFFFRVDEKEPLKLI